MIWFFIRANVFKNFLRAAWKVPTKYWKEYLTCQRGSEWWKCEYWEKFQFQFSALINPSINMWVPGLAISDGRLVGLPKERGEFIPCSTYHSLWVHSMHGFCLIIKYSAWFHAEDPPARSTVFEAHSMFVRSIFKDFGGLKVSVWGRRIVHGTEYSSESFVEESRARKRGMIIMLGPKYNPQFLWGRQANWRVDLKVPLKFNP